MDIQITPKAKKSPLVINYGEDKFELSARIPSEMIGAQTTVPRPPQMVGQWKKDYEMAVGTAVIAAFIAAVLPQEFKDVLDFEDVGQVFQAWSEYSGWGKAKNSDASE